MVDFRTGDLNSIARSFVNNLNANDSNNTDENIDTSIWNKFAQQAGVKHADVKGMTLTEALEIVKERAMELACETGTTIKEIFNNWAKGSGVDPELTEDAGKIDEEFLEPAAPEAGNPYPPNTNEWAEYEVIEARKILKEE